LRIACAWVRKTLLLIISFFDLASFCRNASSFMNKLLYGLLAAVGLAGAGWFGYPYLQGGKTSIEMGQGAPAASGKGGDAKGSDGKVGPGAAASGAAGGGGPGGPGGRGPGGPVGVEVGKAETMALSDDAVAVGTLRANESVVVKPEIAGRISMIGFVDGGRVTKGTLLVQIDNLVASAEVEQAKAELALAQSNFQRTSDLAAKNFVSDRAKDEAGSSVKVLDAKLKVAQAKLLKNDIRAPFNGVLGLRNVSVGDFVKDGAELVTIEDVSTMKVDLRLPERYISQLQAGQTVNLSVDALPGKSFKAAVIALDAQVDANGRALLVRGKLANQEGVLRTGMFAKAKIVLKEKPLATVVPEEAITPFAGKTYVFKVDAGKATRVEVQTGIRKDGKVEVSVLVPGDQVVTAGQQKIRGESSDVRIIDPNRRGPPGGAGGPPGAGKSGDGKAPEGKAPEGKGGEGKADNKVDAKVVGPTPASSSK
jgi:membrane fusion protein, multidrug efflux system